MILVLGGTTEGRELAKILKEMGYRYVLSVAGPLGKEFADGCQELISGELDYNQLKKLVDDGGFRVILDATHPYAEQIKLAAQQVAKEKGLVYLRYQRLGTRLPEVPNLIRTVDYRAGLRVLEQSDGGVFLTVGVRQLHVFQSLWVERERQVWAKVLPVGESLERCSDLGLRPEQIFAFHGSGSKEMVAAILKQTGAEWLVTKESGSAGGTDLKIAAALELGRRVLVIDRPEVKADWMFDNYQAILEWLVKYKS